MRKLDVLFGLAGLGGGVACSLMAGGCTYTPLWWFFIGMGGLGFFTAASLLSYAARGSNYRSGDDHAGRPATGREG